MANTFLGHEYVTPIEIVSENPAFVSDTLNLRRQIVSQGVQRWRFRITFWEATGSRLLSDFMSDYMVNHTNSFALNVPQNFDVEDDVDAPADISVTGAQAAGDTDVGLTSTANFTIPKGLLIKFDNHDKVYIVTEGIDNASSGTLKIQPGLTNALSSTNDIVVEDVQATVTYDLSQAASFSYTRGNQQRITVDFIEDL